MSSYSTPESIVSKIVNDIEVRGAYPIFLGNAKVFYLGSRFHVFKDASNWLIVLELTQRGDIYVDISFIAFSGGKNYDDKYFTEVDNYDNYFLTGFDYKVEGSVLSMNGVSLNLPDYQVVKKHLLAFRADYMERFHIDENYDSIVYLYDTQPDLFKQPIPKIKVLIGTELDYCFTIDKWNQDEIYDHLATSRTSIIYQIASWLVYGGEFVQDPNELPTNHWSQNQV